MKNKPRRVIASGSSCSGGRELVDYGFTYRLPVTSFTASTNAGA